MTRLRIIGLAVAVVLLGFPDWSQAQYTRPVNRPAYSPYLNLTRPGNRTLNYYGLVRPEIEARTAIQGLQGQVIQLREADQEQQQANTDVLPPTGYNVRFLDYGRYFGTGPGLGSGQGQSSLRGVGTVRPGTTATTRPPSTQPRRR